LGGRARWVAGRNENFQQDTSPPPAIDVARRDCRRVLGRRTVSNCPRREPEAISPTLSSSPQLLADGSAGRRTMICSRRDLLATVESEEYGHPAAARLNGPGRNLPARVAVRPTCALPRVKRVARARDERVGAGQRTPPSSGGPRGHGWPLVSASTCEPVQRLSAPGKLLDHRDRPASLLNRHRRRLGQEPADPARRGAANAAVPPQDAISTPERPAFALRRFGLPMRRK